jgi:Adenylate kinase and related kinases
MSIDLSTLPDKVIYNEFLRRFNCAQNPERRIILFGPPASGKGTQGEKLTHQLCACHISTGDLLRHEIQQKTEIGNKVDEIMKKGELVPDDLVIDLLQKKLNSEECKRAAIFDGYPRTLNQAKKLDEMLAKEGKKIDKVFNFDIDEATVVERYASS